MRIGERDLYLLHYLWFTVVTCSSASTRTVVIKSTKANIAMNNTSNDAIAMILSYLGENILRDSAQTPHRHSHTERSCGCATYGENLAFTKLHKHISTSHLTVLLENGVCACSNSKRFSSTSYIYRNLSSPRSFA